MKATEKLSDAINAINVYQHLNGENIELTDAIRYINEFILANQTQVKKGKINIFDYVNKDPLRPQYNGVYYDSENENAVATNGFSMFVSKNLFNAELSGKIVNKKGEFISLDGHRYPNYMKVIDSFMDSKQMSDIELPDFFTCDYICECIKETKALKKGDKNMKVFIKIMDSFYLNLDSAKLVKDLDFSTLTIKRDRESPYYQAIVSKTEKEIAIIMPVFMDSDSEKELKKNDLVYTY